MPTQSTEVSQDEAQRLGFRPPVPQNVPAPVPHATTNVLGYFNNNPWPVHIAISQIGIAIHLDQRGHFVSDGQGRKINDPILEQFVGPGQLDREISNAPVAVRYFARPGQAPTDDRNVVREAIAFQQTPHGVRPIMAPVRPEAPQLPQHSTPVVGMTMEQAREYNFVRPVVEPQEPTVTDTTGAPVRGEQLLTLDEATPRDMKPGEYRRWLAQRQAQPAAAPAPQKLTPSNPQTAVPISNVQNAVPLNVALPVAPIQPVMEDVPHSHLEAGAPENAAQAALQQTMMTAASDTTVMDDAVQAALRTTTPAVAQPVISPVVHPAPIVVTEAPMHLPPPNIPGGPAPVPVAPKARFVCGADGKEFDYRSQLKAYVERKFPDRATELLSPYPATRS